MDIYRSITWLVGPFRAYKDIDNLVIHLTGGTYISEKQKRGKEKRAAVYDSNRFYDSCQA